jgi:O-antigen/teichoic acid export membrane protein
MGVRRAFLWASLGRYLVMAVNLAATLILARLLAPQEYGITVLGGAVFAIAEALRGLGGGAYLIQKAELAAEDIRACFTVSLVATIAIAATLALSAGPLAHFFDMPHLERYLRVVALGFLTGPFIYPISAMMSRNLAFGPIAAISFISAFVNAAVSITLATRGFGYMSFAWASAVSTAVAMLAYLCFWKDRSIFRPIFRRWRGVLRFGIYDSATGLIVQVADALPYFIFGRLFTADVVGLSQRTVSLCLVPERIILAGVGAVALPAFSQSAREGKSLRHDYLRAIELITAAQWPSLCLMILLAQPLVSVLLGAQWLAVVPYLRILALALFFSFPITLHYAIIVATGAIRYMPVILGIQTTVSITILTVAARHGLYPAVLSSLVILPSNGILALAIARRFVGFRWSDVFLAVRRSILATIMGVSGPAAIVLFYGASNIPVGAAVLAFALCGVAWLAGLSLTRHPLLKEMLRVFAALRNSHTAARLGALRMRLFGR